MFLLVISLGLTACKSESKLNSIVKDKPVNNPENTEKQTVKDFFPFKRDTLYEYVGIGDEFASQRTYIEFLSDDRAQMKISNTGMDIIKILEYKDGEICEVYTEGEFSYIENKLDIEEKETSVVLKEPLQVGTSWSISNGRKRSITATDVEIDLPYGKLSALEVTTELEDERKQLDYYSKNLGHVASIYKDGDFEVKTLLNKIHRGPISYKSRFYYPLNDGRGMIYKDREIEFKTNGNIEKAIELAMKNPENETLIPLMSEDAKIKGIKMDRSNNILKVDFDKQFLKDNMQMGSFLEQEIVQSIVNTLGDLYETNKVFISVEGKPYESGHMLLKEGEYFETIDKAIKIVD